jgi:tetratricopeptide (TPR) repeat protein
LLRVSLMLARGGGVFWVCGASASCLGTRAGMNHSGPKTTVLAMKKKFPEAIQQWEEGLKFEPNNKTLLQYIGSAYKDMGQPEKAQTYLNRASAQ